MKNEFGINGDILYWINKVFLKKYLIGIMMTRD